MTYTFATGSNTPRPRRPILPYCRESLTYRFRIGQEWWDGDLTAPIPGFGLKLPSIGRFNYHRGGMGMAIIHEHGKVYIVPRYYEVVRDGVNRNHELVQYRMEIEPLIWYTVQMNTNRLMWRVDGRLLHYVDYRVPCGWLTPIFIGKGTDQNYIGDFVTRSGAARPLTIEIK